MVFTYRITGFTDRLVKRMDDMDLQIGQVFRAFDNKIEEYRKRIDKIECKIRNLDPKVDIVER